MLECIINNKISPEVKKQGTTRGGEMGSNGIWLFLKLSIRIFWMYSRVLLPFLSKNPFPAQ